MKFAKVNSVAVVGLTPNLIDVEVNIESKALPRFEIVGLPGKAVEEARERVRSAIKSGGFEFPNQKIVVNLAPADIPKEGPIYDLPIALGILVASEQLFQSSIHNHVFLGELSLSGDIRGIHGVLPASVYCHQKQLTMVAPTANLSELEIVRGLTYVATSSLSELVNFLREDTMEYTQATGKNHNYVKTTTDEIDFKYIHGQEYAKRAIEIAAAGGHNILLDGPPGCGKSLLAKAFPTILPDLNHAEQLEVSSIHSIVGLNKGGILSTRPVRAPHHSISKAGLIGGGSRIKPGEISLAHRGVLYLDEFPEFPRAVLESLRQPMEDGEVTISRVMGNITFPTKFMLVASQNPCPCGYYGTNIKECRCSLSAVNRYRARVSGPLIDRIDMFISLDPVKIEKLLNFDDTNHAESSSAVRKRVSLARRRQEQRFAHDRAITNSEIPVAKIRDYCAIDDTAKSILTDAGNSYKLSARAINRILKVSRTIADLEGSLDISSEHIAEALQYRKNEH